MKKATVQKISLKKGYVALVAVIITAVVGMMVVASVSSLAYSGSSVANTWEQGEKARGLANACAELALQKLNNSSLYVGTANIPIGDGTCTYTVTQITSLLSVISAQGNSGSVTRKVKVAISVSSIMPVLQITSWQEVADF